MGVILAFLGSGWIFAKPDLSGQGAGIRKKGPPNNAMVPWNALYAVQIVTRLAIRV